ncbi:MAG: type II secretion system protein GspC [Pseudomonadota bacterium]
MNANWTDFSSLDKDRLIGVATTRLPVIATVLFVIALGWQLSTLFWLLVPGSASGDPITVQPPASAAASNRARMTGSANVEAIANVHVFGEAKEIDEPQEPVPTPTEDLAETRLALTLKGTMAGTDDELTVAIIEDNTKEEKIYAIGDAVAAGATLHSVYPDQVVLRRGGVLESLKLPKDLPAGSAPVRQQTTVARTAQPAQSPSLQSTITQNASKLADVIRPTPYFVGGQQQGYRVYPGRDRKQFAALGLRPGDLIKDIDGASLTDPQQALQIFQNLGTADQVSVTVERNGQPQVLVLSTSQLSLEEEDDQ